jgi:oxygen-independent coproporphyrinogen-3 oxidase
MRQNHALYFQIPFCTHRCAYCDFNTYAGQVTLLPAYVDALCREIEFVSSSSPERLSADTIFFGGGTPSLLDTKQFEQILKRIYIHFDISEAEISLEANPGTVTEQSLRDLKQLGFNRISFGVQSFHPDELRALERIHDPYDVFDAITWARRAGFDNVNLDLIYGLPLQSLDRWSASLENAVRLYPEHLSLYALTIEQGTPFGRWAARGLMPSTDPDAAAEMYEWGSKYLNEKRYEQYEISNWSKPGFACQHNLQIWRNRPYLGFGAGAHGYAGGIRYSNVLRIKTYLERMSSSNPSFNFPLSPATVSNSKLSLQTQMQETMLLGLRLTGEGVNAGQFKTRYGIPVQEVFGKEIEELTRHGLLEWDGEGLRLTKRGRLLGNQVFIKFID